MVITLMLMNPCNEEGAVKLAALVTSVFSGKKNKFHLKNQGLQFS